MRNAIKRKERGKGENDVEMGEKEAWRKRKISVLTTIEDGTFVDFTKRRVSEYLERHDEEREEKRRYIVR